MEKENNYDPKKDKLWNKGLSTGEAEEAGDFTGSGKITESSGDKSRITGEDSSYRGPDAKNEPKKAPGTIPYEPDYEKIPVGNTGSNKQRVPGVDKWGPGEA